MTDLMQLLMDYTLNQRLPRFLDHDTYDASQALEARPCLKIGEMPDWGIFLCQARRFFAGGLSPGKENQRSPDGIRCPETAFC